jgi:hypothetical protein
MADAKPRIAVFAGPAATIMNSAPLVTSNLARRRHGLKERTDPWGNPLPFDLLRPQRLAKPVTVYVEQFSAHPLERDAAHLYAPPDGYLDASGEFHRERTGPDDRPVYEIELRPEDGVVPLPYVARQADGSAWDGDEAFPGAPADKARQPFYPDAARIFEEVNRLGQDDAGVGNLLAREADYDFYRAVPPGGYPTGRRADERTDVGEGDIAPEQLNRDYFPYRPRQFRREPPRGLLAKATNDVTAALAGGRYAGALWLEGSPTTEETTYWLNLLIDTTVPIVGCQSPDAPHGVLGQSGDRHMIDAVRYITSGVWKDEAGRDRVGAVLISAHQLYSSRDATKGDARPGGIIAAGGHGGIVGSSTETGHAILTYIPVFRSTWRSDVRLSQLPESVPGVARSGSGPARRVDVRVRDAQGRLLPEAIPVIGYHKHGRWIRSNADASPDEEVAILAQIDQHLASFPLSGFVAEGSTPYGGTSQTADAALQRATFLGMPVARVSRGNPEGFVPLERAKLSIAGSNLTSTKARILLQACLLKFGALPVARDPDNPTKEEIAATERALDPYREVFATH